ncbi:MAG TPA: haloacid dehalogenase [Actinomycetota bacterium]|nr:haloacid dehalogenase [Actinomycetota bacterium]
MDLDSIRSSLRNNLDAKYESREQGLTLCRKAIRLSANSIRAVHRGDGAEAERLQGEARSCLEQAATAMTDHPDIRHAGFYHDASKEYAESRITHALVFGLQLPTPEEIGVEAPAYLNGMGEAIGEVRRHILDLLRRGDLKRSEGLMDVMDEIYYLLITMDYPDAMTGGLRRTTDVARSIIERTRGDLSTTIIQQGLKNALEEGGHNRPR